MVYIYACKISHQQQQLERQMLKCLIYGTSILLNIHFSAQAAEPDLGTVFAFSELRIYVQDTIISQRMMKCGLLFLFLIFTCSAGKSGEYYTFMSTDLQE